MTSEQIVVMIGLLISLGFGLREVFKYWWKKTTRYIDNIEVQLESLLGTPERDGKPAVEGKVPKLERQVRELETDRESLQDALQKERADRKRERDRERAEHKEDIRKLTDKHDNAMRTLVAQHKTDVKQAVEDAIAPLKKQHAEELRVANENADKWQQAAKDSQRAAEESQSKIQTLQQTVERMQGEIDELKKRDTGKLDPLKVPDGAPEASGGKEL